MLTKIVKTTKREAPTLVEVAELREKRETPTLQKSELKRALYLIKPRSFYLIKAQP